MKPDDITPGPWRDDPIVAEVHAARARLLAEAGGDLDVLFENLKASQDRRSGRRVLPPSRTEGHDADAA